MTRTPPQPYRPALAEAIPVRSIGDVMAEVTVRVLFLKSLTLDANHGGGEFWPELLVSADNGEFVETKKSAQDHQVLNTGETWAIQDDDGTPFAQSVRVRLSDQGNAVGFDMIIDPQHGPVSYDSVTGCSSIGFSGDLGSCTLAFVVTEDLRQAVLPTTTLPANPEGTFDLDKGKARWILSLDGGGLRGIIPLLCLRELEQYYGKRCLEMFDMFAGTSTGAIIAASLAYGASVDSLIAMYCTPEIRRQIFTSNLDGPDGQVAQFRNIDLGFATVGSIFDSIVDFGPEGVQPLIEPMVQWLASALMVPKYTKVGVRQLLQAAFPYQTIGGSMPSPLTSPIPRLDQPQAPVAPLPFPLPVHQPVVDPVTGQSFLNTPAPGGPSATQGTRAAPFTRAKDVFLTARDLVRCETVYLTAFHDPTTGEIRGTYHAMLLKDAVELSLSAPTFFDPRAGFVDGGVGSYTNPCFAAALEALEFSHIDVDHPDGGGLAPFYSNYRESGEVREGTVMWSFGTGQTPMPYDLKPQHDQKPNDQNLITFWAKAVIDATFWDANQQQVVLCEHLLKDRMRFFRFDLTLTPDSLRTIGFTETEDPRLLELISHAKTDPVELVDFLPVLAIGVKYSAFLRAQKKFRFAVAGDQTGRDFAGQTTAAYRRAVFDRLAQDPGPGAP